MMIRRLVSALLLLPAFAFAQSVDLNTISKVEVKGSSIEITGTKKPNFTTFTMTDPPRLVIDISEAVFSGVPDEMQVANGTVTAIKTASYGSDASAIARVLIGFEKELETDIQSSGSKLVVRVMGGGGQAVAQAETPAAETGAGTDTAAADTQRREQEAERQRREQEAAATAEAERKRQADAQAEADRKRQEQEAQASAAAAAEERRRQEQAAKESEAAAEAERKRQAEAQAKAERDAAASAEAERKQQEQDARASTEAERRENARAEAARKKEEEAAAKASAAEERKRQQEEARAEAARKKEEEAAAKASAAEERKAQQEEARAEAARKREEEAAAKAQAAEDRRRQQEEARASRVASAAPSGGDTGGQLSVSGKRKTMQLVGFKQQPGASRVFVRTNEPVRYTVSKGSGNSVIVELENTRIDLGNNERWLDTSYFDTAVAMIDPQPGPTRTVRIEIKLKESVPYQTSQEGNELYVDFERPARR